MGSYKSIFSLLGGLMSIFMFQGCTTITGAFMSPESYPLHERNLGRAGVIILDNERRVIMVDKDTGNQCVVPMPDTMTDRFRSVKFDGNVSVDMSRGDAANGNGGIHGQSDANITSAELYRRSEAAEYLRESNFMLCQGTFNFDDNITSVVEKKLAAYKELYKRALDKTFLLSVATISVENNMTTEKMELIIDDKLTNYKDCLSRCGTKQKKSTEYCMDYCGDK